MPNQIDIFKKAAALRDQLTAEQAKRIQDMYKDLAKKIAKEAKNPKYSIISSGSLTQQYLNQLKKQIETWSKELSNGLFTTTQGTMNLISDAVVSDSVDWLHSLGLGTKKGIAAAFSNVNQSVVNAILTGSVYGQAGSWSLSKSIWGDNQKNLSKIYALIAEGYAAQMPVGDIADMISKYVDPTKKLDWTGSDGKRIYGHKVDYNAQRLVRTISQHTYQQSIVQCAQDNPFISGFIWHANGSRVCEVCKKRDGKFYKKDELPLDHPNGMCVMEPVVSKNMSKDLAGWVKGTNKNPDIDAFAKKLGYQPKEADGLTLGDIKKKYGDLAKGKKIAQFQHKLPKDVQDQLKKLKLDSGLSWDDFFTKNFDGAVSEKVKTVKKAVASKLDDVAEKVASDVADKLIDQADDIAAREAAERLAKEAAEKAAREAAEKAAKEAVEKAAREAAEKAAREAAERAAREAAEKVVDDAVKDVFSDADDMIRAMVKQYASERSDGVSRVIDAILKDMKDDPEGWGIFGDSDRKPWPRARAFVNFLNDEFDFSDLRGPASSRIADVLQYAVDHGYINRKDMGRILLLNNYCGTGAYANINSYLRGTLKGRELKMFESNGIPDVVKKITGAMDDEVLDKGFDSFRYYRNTPAKLKRQFKEGAIFSDDGFVSVTTREGHSFADGADIIAHVHVPAGKGRGIDAQAAEHLYPHNYGGNLNEVDGLGENEFVLRPGTKFRVNKVVDNSDTMEVWMEVVDDV